MIPRLAYLLLATFLLPLAAAVPHYDVGASGACNDSGPITLADQQVSSETGGQGEVTLVDGSHTVSVVDDPTGVPLAVLAFVNDPTSVPSGDGCTSAGDDRVEAHAETDAAGVQACWDGSAADLTGPCTMHN